MDFKRNFEKKRKCRPQSSWFYEIEVFLLPIQSLTRIFFSIEGKNQNPYGFPFDNYIEKNQ